jgi:hypothetical protein
MNRVKFRFKKINSGERGYLLLEALISLSLLAAALIACVDSFSIAHHVQKKCAAQELMTACAEQKLIELSFDHGKVTEDCAHSIEWRTVRTLVSPRLEQITLHGSLKEKNNPYEDQFQIFRALF